MEVLTYFFQILVNYICYITGNVCPHSYKLGKKLLSIRIKLSHALNEKIRIVEKFDNLLKKKFTHPGGMF